MFRGTLNQLALYHMDVLVHLSGSKSCTEYLTDSVVRGKKQAVGKTSVEKGGGQNGRDTA